ncbi:MULTISPECIES: site-specific integrase [Spongiibacter]|jgi:integrase|uniref:site-specific integrase n=2 Tax=Spongiibacteraceae TaxID=1706375 RepID=UPI00195FD0A3|nr:MULTISPECIES: site-specific integrase [Spongiibacter]MBM7425003.1 integrase [Spongiibacter marinus]|tara:strand:- start:6495 stop:7265 length:771 start_codon:yes stop_codon:yes gene_type:complete
MPKSGQARVLTAEQQDHVFDVIQHHRHPEKNTAIMQISFKLGLRAQEIALLQVKEIAKLNPSGTEFKLLEVMSLPAAYTKGADAMGRSQSRYQRKTVSFDVASFNQVIRQIEALAKAGADVNPEDFYPPVRKHRGKSRDLPMVDAGLRGALAEYLRLRIDKSGTLMPSSPLFITQKGGAYSPNTLQEHMAVILRHWAGVEKASSHSGRRSLITNVIHKQKKSVKVAQKIAGHVNPSTTLIYEEPPEQQISEALESL